ncbi:hypothetical protein BJ742DRAFT_96837 [Cladochytrium replicatum]|nr:hypothetical protein BJ742DRAFT_96837 [Cladochytrium replicatum]
MTYFGNQATACGESGFSNSDFIVAINRPQWKNNLCHRNICIKYQGKTAVAKVIDECAPCPFGAIDASKGLFGHFDALSKGELYGVEWDFCDGNGGAELTTTTTSSSARQSSATTITTASTTIAANSTTTTSTSAAAPVSSSVALPSQNAQSSGELDPNYPAVEDRRACYREGGAVLDRRDEIFADVPIVARFNGYPMSDDDLRKRGIVPGVDEVLEKRLKKKRSESEL